MKRFGFTMGDGGGIGAEIIVKALKERPQYVDECIIFGNVGAIRFYANRLNLKNPVHIAKSVDDVLINHVNVFDPYPVPFENFQIGRVSELGGGSAFAYICAAIDAAKAKKTAFTVTAPINKEGLQKAGHNYPGHTEIFAQKTDCKRYAMILWSDKLKTIFATTHIPLSQAAQMISRQRIVDVISIADETLKKAGFESPRIAVAGLNPHAGENGVLGKEEAEIINPAIDECAKNGILVSGAFAPDTIFLRAYRGQFDIVVSIYHDQGCIPFKLLAFDSGVNITAGLNIIRTSPDHGTAFEIAGKLIASPESLINAVETGKKFSGLRA